MRNLIGVVLGLFIIGCSSTMNDSMTPDPKRVISKFDNSIEIYQKNVSSASGLSEDWTTIGLFWTDRHPDVVVINAGVTGIANIDRIAFNVDGEITEYKNSTTIFTQFEDNEYLNWSTKGFVVPMKDFEKIARAQSVKFKVVLLNNTYSVSTFGAAHPEAIISMKLPKFLALIDKKAH